MTWVPGRKNVRTTSVLCMSSDSVLMVHQHNSRGSGWTLPGGKVDPGESFQEAVLRECREETAITLLPPAVQQLECVSLVEARCPEIHLIRAVFCAQLVGARPQPFVADVGGEVTDAEFKPLAEALSLLQMLPVPAQRIPFEAALVALTGQSGQAEQAAAGHRMSYYSFSTDQPGVGLVEATYDQCREGGSGQLVP